jgi:hypothetical protein
MFWDGQRWIPDERPTGRRAPAQSRPRRLRDWLATIPVALLVPMLLVPMLLVEAGHSGSGGGSPVLQLRGSVSPGSSAKLVGTGFAPSARAAILWDSSAVLGDLKTNARGSFTTGATIPADASAGKHLIAVAYLPVATGDPPAATIEVALAAAANSDPTAAPGPTAPPTAAPGPTAPPAPTPAPTPNPTPAATPPPPDPTPNPTPDPTPPPPTSTRPFPAPVTDATYKVPASIDASGSSDASGELIAFIKTVPNGSVVSFAGTGVYRLDKGLLLAGRRNLVLDGNGATLRMKGAGSDEAASAFLLRGSSHIAIRDFTVVGNNPNTTTLFVPGNENAHVLSLSGWYGGGPSSFVEISNVTASHLYGDGAYLEGRNVAPYEPSHDVWIHDNAWSYIGRNAVSSIDVTDVLVEENNFAKIGMDAWDLEPNFAAQQVRRNTFRRNTIGSYSHMTQQPGYFVSSWNPTGQSPISDILVAGNTVAGIASSNFDGAPRGLTSKFIVPNTSNIVFRNNTTTRAAVGPVLYFNHVNGVTVTGNSQPVVSGAVAGFSNCTDVVHD